MRISDLSTDTVKLYRGDASHVVHFEVGKTDAHALFGRGIYLTDSPVVAADYTFKQSDGVVFPESYREHGEYSSKEELLRAYLGKIARDIGFEEAHAKLRDQWRQKINVRRQEIYAKMDRPTYDDIKRETADLQAGFQADRQKLAQKFVAKAKKVYAGMSVKMAKKTTGEWVFVKSDRGGVISVFEVPKAYCDQTLDAEAPIPDSLLPVMKAAFYANNKIPDSPLDLRSWDENGGQRMGLTFDQYIADFKTKGTFYAWADRNIGGKGVNPSIDEMLNGTHQGYYVWKDSQDVLVRKLMAMGYVGFRYQGGVRIAGQANRGGGGILHQAFSFWDEKKINSYRVDHRPRDPDFDPEPATGIRAKRVLNI